MAAAAEMAKGPHLRLVWLSENINEVHGVLAELWAGYSLAVVQRQACASAAEQWQWRWSTAAAAEGRREAGNEMWRWEAHGRALGLDVACDGPTWPGWSAQRRHVAIHAALSF